MKKRIIGGLTVLLYLGSCNLQTSSNKNSIPTDSKIIAAGEESFNINCSGCHNFNQDAIGPLLSGVTIKASAEWIGNFIKDPQKMISSGDERAAELYKKYKTAMPAFNSLKEDEIKSIIAFLNIHQQPGKQLATKNDNALLNPIPEPIKFSGLTGDLKLITQIPSSGDSGKTPLARITKMGIQPTSNNLFILDLRGKLYRLQNNKPAVYMDMAKLRNKFISEPGLATGFGSFAFHPDFFKNGLLYTTHTEAPGSARADFGYADSIKVTLQWVLTEWKTTNPTAEVFSGTSRELMRINMVSGIHGMQEIAFNPFTRKDDKDYGLLYLGVGDGGCTENGFPFLAHSKEKIWGTILRIDPAGRNSDNGKYGIPQTNPFVHDPDRKVLGEIYAWGFRNPHRISWNKSGNMIACNIGQANIESIDLIKPGQDYGWPMREGNFVLNTYGDLAKVYPLPANDSIYNITYPIAEYDHDEGKAVAGGFEYSGISIQALKGKYLFGDIPTGRLFYIDMADIRPGKQIAVKEWKISLNGKIQTLKELCGNERVDLHFGKDSRGEIYVLTKADGKIYELQNATMQNIN